MRRARMMEVKRKKRKRDGRRGSGRGQMNRRRDGVRQQADEKE